MNVTIHQHIAETRYQIILIILYNILYYIVSNIFCFYILSKFSFEEITLYKKMILRFDVFNILINI